MLTVARKHEAVKWLRSGSSPAQIAHKMGVTFETVMGYLYNQVGEGEITRSDLLFAIAPETRDAVDAVTRQKRASSSTVLEAAISESFPGVHKGEAVLYMQLRQPHVYLQDMYSWLSVVEQYLHRYIKTALLEAFGADWWRKGVPEKIREECARTLERDAEPAKEPYCYTTFIQLKEIFEKRWDLFSKLLPPGPASDRRLFLSGLGKLNHLRNCVMHPAKGITPEESDFRFLREFINFVQMDKWF